MAIDTTCSSALVAMHSAMSCAQATSSALSAGTHGMLAPHLFLWYTGAHILSALARCGTFDASADGYLRGEGCGSVVLHAGTRHADEVSQLVGAAVNQDGRTATLSAPNGPAQQEVIRAAWRASGFAAAQLITHESHGTGTPLGDPIEYGATPCVHGVAARGSHNSRVLKDKRRSPGACRWSGGRYKDPNNIAQLVLAPQPTPA